jgi:predicted nucleotidyltransferase component of viral defense system
LVRLQEKENSPWVLKGGFALELRLGERARMTKDLDLGVDLGYFHPTEVTAATVARKLREDVSSSNTDYFTFVVPEIGEPDLNIPGVTVFRYSVEARLDGRRFETNRIDVGLGDPLIPPFDTLESSDLLSFANIPRATFRATSRAQHLAEKIHALTRPYEDRINTRVKDLADIILLLNLGLPNTHEVKKVVTEVFVARKTHEIPTVIEPQPKSWATPYSVMAKELDIAEIKLDSAITRINDYWKKLFP